MAKDVTLRKLFIEKEATVWVNGKKTVYPAGLQDVPADHANILIASKDAKPVDGDKKAK